MQLWISGCVLHITCDSISAAAGGPRKVPSLGWLQIVGFAGIVELNVP